jgi:hypothetical protein
MAGCDFFAQGVGVSVLTVHVGHQRDVAVTLTQRQGERIRFTATPPIHKWVRVIQFAYGPRSDKLRRVQDMMARIHNYRGPDDMNHFAGDCMEAVHVHLSFCAGQFAVFGEGTAPAIRALFRKLLGSRTNPTDFRRLQKWLDDDDESMGHMSKSRSRRVLVSPGKRSRATRRTMSQSPARRSVGKQ